MFDDFRTKVEKKVIGKTLQVPEDALSSGGWEAVKKILPGYIDLPKSKTAKIIRTLYDMCFKFPGKGRIGPLIDLSKHIIDWCEKESRSFLRMKIESKLAELYFK